MTGVLQGLVDLYMDAKRCSMRHLSWDSFISKYVIILIADGYKNLNQTFKTNAETLGIFIEDAMEPFIEKD